MNYVLSEPDSTQINTTLNYTNIIDTRKRFTKLFYRKQKLQMEKPQLNINHFETIICAEENEYFQQQFKVKFYIRFDARRPLSSLRNL